jgi:hypothetical protein
MIDIRNKLAVGSGSALSVIRVNLKIDRELQPELFDALLPVRVKKRAGVLRRLLDSGLGVKNNRITVDQATGVMSTGDGSYGPSAVVDGTGGNSAAYNVPDSFRQDLAAFAAGIEEGFE